jgi:fructose-1,6-bisphosphatase/inositol monophosphatase family enzyme
MSDSDLLLQEYAFELGEVVKHAGEKILEFHDKLVDVGNKHGHEQSSIDNYAFEVIMGQLQQAFGKFEHPDGFAGTYHFEIGEYSNIEPKDGKSALARGVLRVDEIDGTTNAKRTLASKLKYRPRSCISIALSLDERLGSIKLGAVYDIMHATTWMGLRFGNMYQTWHNREVLNAKDFCDVCGDTANRILVVGYSNNKREEKGLFEQAIINHTPGGNFKIYDGSRSSTYDVLSIIMNQYDAYIDPRALWEKGGAVLHPYDIAGVIPIAFGCGLEISDLSGNPIDNMDGNGDINILISRPAIKEELLDAIGSFLKTPGGKEA